MLGIGLGANQTPSDFDVMSAISTAQGLDGLACGKITDPVPGDFYPVSNIDDMLFAFDALNPDPGTTQQGPVCQLQVCPEARHNFVLDRSIKSVNILGSGGVAGVVPYLMAPSGETLELPKKDGRTTAAIAGVPVTYEWQSESAQTISLQNTGAPQWAGQWAIVYVDTTGQHPDAVSKVSIHITTDIFPALTGEDKVAWHSGQVLKGVTFGLVDGQGKPIQPTDLAGTAMMSASLAPDGAAPIGAAVGRQGRHRQTRRRRPDQGEPGRRGAANVAGDHDGTGDRPVRRADRTRYTSCHRRTSKCPCRSCPSSAYPHRVSASTSAPCRPPRAQPRR